MKKKDLLKQLNSVKETIKPDAKWQAENREILLCQIKSQTRLDFVTQISNTILLKNIFSSVLKPVASALVVLMLVFGGYIASVSATKKSLPGDFWYNIKLTSERVQVNLTMNDEKKANLEIEFAQRRLDEIDKIVNESSDTSEKNLKVPLKKFQESMDNVKSSLAKLEKTDSQSAAKLATLVDAKTKEYVDVLEGQLGDKPQIAESLAVNTEEAITVSKSAGDKALAVIIKQFEAGESEMSLEEIRAKMSQRIDTLESKAAAAKSDIETIINNKKIAEEKAVAEAEAAAQAEEENEDSEETAEAEEAETEETEGLESAEAAATETEEAEDTEAAEDTTIETEEKNDEEAKAEEPVAEEPKEDLPTIEEIKDKPEQVLALLVKAREFLDSASISQSFDQVKQADEIFNLISKVITANTQYLETVEDEDNAEAKPEDNVSIEESGDNS